MGSIDIYTQFLTRSEGESARLNEQHYLLVEGVGYYLHPTIVESLPKDAHIAEVATGTGIWMNELAERLPETHSYTGFDISDAQFTTKGKTQDRVHFAILDAKTTVPEQYRGKFDVVHVRYLMAAMGDGKWRQVADNIFDLLKPGGWIQWHEAALGQTAQVLRLVPGLPTPASDKMMSIMKEATHIWTSSGERLAGHVSDSGFENVVDEVTSSDRNPDTRRAWTRVMYDAVHRMPLLSESALDAQGISATQRAELLAASIEEADKGAYVRSDQHVVWGRKPLNERS